MRIPATITIERALASAARCTHRGGASLKNRRNALAMIETESLASPNFSYKIYGIQAIADDCLDFGGAHTLKSSLLANASPALARVAVAVSTLGPALEHAVSHLTSQKKYSLAFALDEVGNDLLFYTNRYATLVIRAEISQLGEHTRYFLSPGGPEIGLQQQKSVLHLAGGDPLGITVSEGCVLWPMKSRTMVIGIGEAGSEHPFGRRCATCSSRDKCRYRTQ